MRVPEFTAEASLGKTRERYILTSGTAARSESVLPQFVRGTDLPTAQVICIGGSCFLIWTDMAGNVHGIPLS